MILNLKKINNFVNYKHFKMESINVINLIKPNVYMTSIDLKDAFSSVRIRNNCAKYLKFMFGNLFQFTSMSNGYEPAMRIFTKISNVPFGHLRRSHLSCICSRFISPRRYYVSVLPSNILDTKFIDRTGLCYPPR